MNIGMERLQSILLVLIVLFVVPAVVSSDLTVDKPRMIKEQAPKGTTKKQPPRETRMRATGIVKDITAETLKIVRTPTGEIMEFSLEKPLIGINTDDRVVVSYILKDNKNTAKRVSKANQKKKVVAPPLTAPLSPSPAGTR